MRGGSERQEVLCRIGDWTELGKSYRIGGDLVYVDVNVGMYIGHSACGA